MPLIEALSALSTLVGAYQVVRSTKPAGEPADSADLATSSLLVAYEFAKTAADDAARRLESVRARLGHLTIVGGLPVLGAPAIVATGNDGANLESALFLTAVGLFCFIAVAAILVRNLAPSRPASPRELYEKHLSAPEAGMLDELLRNSHAAYETTQRLVMFGSQALLLLSVLFAAELILLAVWIPAGQ